MEMYIANRSWWVYKTSHLNKFLDVKSEFIKSHTAQVPRHNVASNHMKPDRWNSFETTKKHPLLFHMKDVGRKTPRVPAFHRLFRRAENGLISIHQFSKKLSVFPIVGRTLAIFRDFPFSRVTSRLIYAMSWRIPVHFQNSKFSCRKHETIKSRCMRRCFVLCKRVLVVWLRTPPIKVSNPVFF